MAVDLPELRVHVLIVLAEFQVHVLMVLTQLHVHEFDPSQFAGLVGPDAYIVASELFSVV